LVIAVDSLGVADFTGLKVSHLLTDVLTLMGKCNQDFNFYVTYLLTYLLNAAVKCLVKLKSPNWCRRKFRVAVCV